MRSNLKDARSGYKYPMVRGSGAFLICIGFGILIGALWPGAFPMNIRVFVIAAIVGIVAIPFARRISSLGKPTGLHIGVMSGAVALELVMFWAVFTSLPVDTPPRVYWLWAFLLVGLHFIPMGLALGKRAVILGVACIVIAGAGLLLNQIPFIYLAIADGILKIGFGASMAATGLPRTE